MTPRTPVGVPRRLLDVGTGTGFVLQAFADRFDDLVGNDPDPDLLAVADRELSPLVAIGQVRLIPGSAEEFVTPDGWSPQLVTVCRAFHWFDRPRFLAHVHAMLPPGGVLAVFGDHSIWAAHAVWKDAVLNVVQEFLGTDRRAGDGLYQAPAGDYADDLVRSGFRNVRRERVPVQRTQTIDSVIGYLHSTSFASLAVLGDQANAFDARVRERLEPLIDADGLLVDDNEFDIVTGTV